MFYYGVDLLKTIDGSGVAPFVVIAYIHRLPDDSKFTASVIGDDEWFGWGQDRILMADVYDNITRLTEVTIGTKTGKKPPSLDRFPRPTRKSAKPQSRIAELFASFGGMAGAKK